jgi:hypothetical protein
MTRFSGAVEPSEDRGPTTRADLVHCSALGKGPQVDSYEANCYCTRVSENKRTPPRAYARIELLHHLRLSLDSRAHARTPPARA